MLLPKRFQKLGIDTEATRHSEFVMPWLSKKQMNASADVMIRSSDTNGDVVSHLL